MGAVRRVERAVAREGERGDRRNRCGEVGPGLMEQMAQAATGRVAMRGVAVLGLGIPIMAGVAVMVGMGVADIAGVPPGARVRVQG